MVVRQKVKKIAKERAGKTVAKVRKAAGSVSGRVAAKAAAAKGKTATKLAEKDIAAIAEHVVADLGDSGVRIAQHASGGVDEIAHLVAARLGKTGDLVQEALAKQVDRIVDLVAARIGQSGSLAQQNLEQRAGEIADLVAAKLAQGASGARPQTTQSSPAAKGNTKLSTVPLNWKEVWYTNCPLISASNVDQELGWTREEFKKIGVKYAFLRSDRRNDWYPHYIHNLDNVIRFGGLTPPIKVHGDIRRTRLLGMTHVYEGGCMMVRARDDIYSISELKGKKIGLSKSLNTIKMDWWRYQEEFGIEMMLRKNGMSRKDVEIVEFPYPDDWYNDPKMLEPMENPSETWLSRDHKHDLAFRPLETALLKGVVDAIFTQSKVTQHLMEATGKLKAIEDLSLYPDWTMQVTNVPAVITCTDVMAEEHPELVVAFLKGMIKVGRWANEHKHAAAAILDKQTFYLDVEDTYRGIQNVDIVPNLSAQNLVCVDIGKDFMLSHGYMENDFDVGKWAAPEFLEKAAAELINERWVKVTGDKLPVASTAKLG